MMGFRTVCFEMKGLGGEVYSLRSEPVKKIALACLRNFLNKKLGYIILDINSVFSYLKPSDSVSLGAVFPWHVSICSVCGHSTGIGLTGLEECF